MEILYSDNSIVACVKPVGVDSEGGMCNVLKAELGGEIFSVHRLDMNVGGVMVYARTRKAAAELSRLIEGGKMVKEYIAEVKGEVPETGDWEDLLWKDSKRNKVFVVKRERGGVKKARLEFKRLTCGESSQVLVRLHTGRSHQIRVQFASRGYPLLGDHKYGARDERTAPMLFSCRISLPWGGKNTVFEATPEWCAVEKIPQ
ncbi:MAG: RNA pseudouridine synthase [Clostridia bacterium]|nr:RNA pseudouridine synthase [Clostridia bacterium]